MMPKITRHLVLFYMFLVQVVSTLIADYIFAEQRMKEEV